MESFKHTLNELTHAIRELACEMKHQSNNQAILHRIEQAERNIMSAIADFSAKQNQFNARQAAAIDSAVASVNGLTSDISELNAKIQELQNSQGAVTAEDQALINDLETQGEAVAAKGEALAAALKTVDEQNPPKPPVA